MGTPFSILPSGDPIAEARFGLKVAFRLGSGHQLPWPAAALLEDRNIRAVMLEPSGRLVGASAGYLATCQGGTDASRLLGPELLLGQHLSLLEPGPLADEWTAIAARVANTSHAEMAYQLIGGYRTRLLFVPSGCLGDATEELDGLAANIPWKPTQERGEEPVVVIACRTLCNDGEAIDRLQPVQTCGYGTLGDLDHLSMRELELLRALGLDQQQALTATALACNVRAVQRLAKRLREKLNVRDNFALAVIAIQRGLIDFTDEQWHRTVFVRQAQAAADVARSQRPIC